MKFHKTKNIPLKFVVLIAILFFISSPLLKSQTDLPPVILKSLDGDETRLSDFKALQKPLIISFWATYCGPCLEEFKAVSEQYATWKKLVDFEFIAVSIDEPGSSAGVKSLATAKCWPFIVLLDENKDVRKAMDVDDIPLFCIYDKTGKLVYKHYGYNPGNESIMISELKKINSSKP